MKTKSSYFLLIPAIVACVAIFTQPVQSCTGITLRALDGAVLYGRTMEWGSFDLESRVVIIPRGSEFTALTPDKKPGEIVEIK